MLLWHPFINRTLSITQRVTYDLLIELLKLDMKEIFAEIITNVSFVQLLHSINIRVGELTLPMKRGQRLSSITLERRGGAKIIFYHR